MIIPLQAFLHFVQEALMILDCIQQQNDHFLSHFATVRSTQNMTAVNNEMPIISHFKQETQDRIEWYDCQYSEARKFDSIE